MVCVQQSILVLLNKKKLQYINIYVVLSLKSNNILTLLFVFTKITFIICFFKRLVDYYFPNVCLTCLVLIKKKLL